MAELFDSLTSWTRFMHFCAVFNCIFSQLEAAGAIISGTFVMLIVPDHCVKLCAPRVNHSREVQTKAF